MIGAHLMRLAALGAAVTVLVTACGASSAGGPSAGQFRFSSATAEGKLIPAAQRKPAAPVEATLFAGGTYRLADHRGRVVVINFWASWCAPCVIESPMLESVYRQYASRSADFVGIDIKDERQAAASFITDNHMTYPMVYDEPGRAALQLGVPVGGLPVTVLIDRRGKVAAVYEGAVHRSTLVPSLQRLLAEQG